ncbi:cytochrome b [Novosphingobium sp. EMRT-2]|uniref:cytochrome b n=1 Tax=Novosphingobium sp. EMRT-2 TaxID=2571749 RepID=UPI00351636BB
MLADSALWNIATTTIAFHACPFRRKTGRQSHVPVREEQEGTPLMSDAPLLQEPLHSDVGSAFHNRYPLPVRLLHWTRAAVILALIALGLIMTTLPETIAAQFAWMYPTHKEFGVLAFGIGVIALVVRTRTVMPPHPAGLAPWETLLSKGVQAGMLILAIVVPLMGYAMSSSYTQSDGVPFFVGDLPELLPKNDRAFAIFQWLHETLAYTLLGLIALHIGGVVKHRVLDKGRETDVLGRML